MTMERGNSCRFARLIAPFIQCVKSSFHKMDNEPVAGRAYYALAFFKDGGLY